MNVCFETFGCRLNRAEALEDEARCIAAGHRIVTDHSEADFFVVRGCSVTARAQRDCEKLIEHLRSKYPTKRVYTTGCLKDSKPIVFKNLTDRPPVPMRTARGYLKVQDGCAGNCTFCIVPRFRGKSVSEDFDTVLDKARRFIDAGYHEIVMTGCNMSLYASGSRRLPDLVAALAELDKGCRIRLGSLEPFLSASETIDAMAGHANVCRFLHMPVQSGSDRILGMMKRPYTADEAESLLVKARKLMPFATLGCDMISGFPGETESDHMKSVSLLTRMKISNVHAFHYSERPGTPAASMAGKIERTIALKRAKELSDRGESNRRAFTQDFLNREVEVVIEKEDRAAGWTGEYLWFEELKDSAAGQQSRNERREMIRFRVRTMHDGRLYGKRI